MTTEKKAKLKKVAKYTGIGIGAAVLGYLGFKYITSDSGPSEEVQKLCDDTCEQISSNMEKEYDRGYNESIVDMINYCRENGKSIVATGSTKGPGEENAECWLVAELFNEKPDLPDILVDDPYSIMLHENK